MQGAVTDVDSDEFTFDTCLRRVNVETDGMAYNPLDDDGYQTIEKGDVVSVAGQMDDDFFEGRVLEADSVTTLRKS